MMLKILCIFEWGKLINEDSESGMIFVIERQERLINELVENGKTRRLMVGSVLCHPNTLSVQYSRNRFIIYSILQELWPIRETYAI